MNRPAIEQALRDLNPRGLRLKQETRMQQLRRERPHLFLTEEERNAIKYQWSNPEDLERQTGHRNLLVGRPAPLLTDEGRAVLRRESAAAASKLYRQRQAIKRARKQRLLEAENPQAPSMPIPAPGH